MDSLDLFPDADLSGPPSLASARATLEAEEALLAEAKRRADIATSAARRAGCWNEANERAMDAAWDAHDRIERRVARARERLAALEAPVASSGVPGGYPAP